MLSITSGTSSAETPGPSSSPIAASSGRIAAERDLIGFDALLLEAENADRADMVMAAGVDAAGNLDAELADEALALEIGEALRDRLRDRDRARRRQRAIVEARAGDDVGDEPGVGGGEARRARDRATERGDRPASHAAE